MTATQKQAQSRAARERRQGQISGLLTIADSGKLIRLLKNEIQKAAADLKAGRDLSVDQVRLLNMLSSMND